MSETPDDIRAKATDLARKIIFETGGDLGQLAIGTEAAIVALMQESERCVKALQPWKRRDHLSLHCGEVTAQEFRTVVAVLTACQASIRSPDKTPNDGDSAT